MENKRKSEKGDTVAQIIKENGAPKGRDIGPEGAVPGINTPGIVPPAFNPPVPNRAWTAMRNGLDVDSLTEEEKRELYYGRDDVL